MPKRRRWPIVLAILLVYVSSYYVLSRRGFAMGNRYGFKGLFFFEPRDSAVWRLSNYGCVFLYYPLIWIDVKLGTGRAPGSEPLWGLSK
jgi:hypothetical protein